MDLHEDNIQIPPTVFESVITLPSSDFKKYGNMYNLVMILKLKCWITINIQL